MQRDTPPDFPPRSVEISGTFFRFRSDSASVEQKVAWVDGWIEKANTKETAMGVRSEEQRQRREDLAREQQELSELNARWAKL
jgi:hypothetical protein